MAKFGIGQAITRREDQRLLTGTGKYVDDVPLKNQAHLVFVRSPHAHARIVSIDTSAAKSATGVVGVFTGADLLADGIGDFPIGPGLKNAAGKAHEPRRRTIPLAVGEVRFVGETVVAVIAQTRAAGRGRSRAGGGRIRRAAGGHDDRSRECSGRAAALGRCAGQRRRADRVRIQGKVRRRFRARPSTSPRFPFYNQRLVPVSMEPRGSVAEFDKASGRLTLHTSCQNPAGLQEKLADAILKMPRAKVRVTVGDVGGGFGMKTMLYPEDAVCAYAARKLGRPVAWRASRSEEFLSSTHGRDQINHAELALDADGKVLGLRIEIVGNVGAYACSPGAIIVVAVGPKVITGVYHIPALHLRAHGGADEYQSGFRVQRGRAARGHLSDRAADESGRCADGHGSGRAAPSQLYSAQRRCPTPRRWARPSTAATSRICSIASSSHADWKGYEKRRAESKARGQLRGRAISTFLEWTGVVHEETIDLHVEADGRILVYTAMQAMGQGIETSYVQILAETLGVDPERFVIVQGDSDIAQGLGSMGSRSLYIGGSAMLTASNDTIEKGRQLAAEALEAAGPDITYRDGRFTVAGTDLGIDLFELAGRQPEKRIAVKTLQKVGGPSWPNSCHVCEVEVDPETGVVQIVKYTTVDDVGRVINPLIVAGQVHGGIAQAVGQALLENTHYDAETGQLVTGSLLDYCVPRADDLPNFSTHTDETTPCKINPLGAKGVGELGTVGGTPTVMNALIDALRPLGVENIEMPATSERVWRAIHQAQPA